MNWQNSIEYSIKYKEAPPPSFFNKLMANEVGYKGQNILVVGSNNGKFAMQLAKAGCQVTAIDICQDYVDESQIQAKKQDLKINFLQMAAEDMKLDHHSFDAIIVYQALKHFQIPRFLTEAKRLLVPGGLLVSAFVRWLPRLDLVAKQSEEIFLQYNSRWDQYDFTGEVFPMPQWAVQLLQLKGMFSYDEDIHFSKEAWVGRLKASSYLSGCLSKSKLIDFESDLQKMLSEIPNENLEIRHRIFAHIFQFK